MPDGNVPTADKKRNDGGPLYPQDYCWPTPLQHLSGISLRDHIALTVLVSLLSDREKVASAARGGGSSFNVFAASLSYEMADAMLAERAK